MFPRKKKSLTRQSVFSYNSVAVRDTEDMVEKILLNYQ